MSVDFMAQWPVDGNRWPEIGEEPVNASNANAVALLEVLGYDSSWPVGGEADPAEFTVRVRRALLVVANVSGADRGEPWTEGGGPGTGQCNWVECGRRPGYFAARLPELEQVAQQAASHEGGMVVWA